MWELFLPHPVIDGNYFKRSEGKQLTENFIENKLNPFTTSRFSVFH